MRIPVVAVRRWRRWTSVEPNENPEQSVNGSGGPLLYCAPACLIAAFVGVALDRMILWVVCSVLLVVALVVMMLPGTVNINKNAIEITLFLVMALVLIVSRLLLLDYMRAANSIPGYADGENTNYMVHAVLDQDVQKSSKSFGGTERYFVKATMKKVRTPDDSSQELNVAAIVFGDYRLSRFSFGDYVEFNAKIKELDKQQRNRYFVTVRSGISLVRPAEDVYGTELLRHTLRRELVKRIDPDVASLTVGMVTGDRSLFSEELDENMKRSGLTHLTAVSGSNCAIVIGFVVFVLRCLRNSKIMVGCTASAALCYFVMVVRPDASVVRASVMAIIALFSLSFGRKKQPTYLLAIVVLGLLMWDPYFSRDYSFLLSVSATLGIIVWAQKLAKALSGYLPPAVAALVAVPLSAHILCAPIIIFIQPQITPYAIVANIAAVPAVAPVTVIGMLALSFSPFSVELARGCIMCASYGASWIIEVANFFSGLPGSAIAWPQGIIGALWLLVIHGILLYGLLFLLSSERQRKRNLRKAAVTVSSLAFQTVTFLRYCKNSCAVHCAVYALAVMYVGFFPGLFQKKPQWSVVMCDVGQGDAFVVKNTREEAFLIDLGNDTEKLKRCIADSKAAIRAIFITHFHDDHYAALKAVYRNGITVYASAATSGIPEADKEIFASIPVTYINSGFSAEFGNIKIRTLWPRPDYRVDAAQENNASLVLALEFITGQESSYHVLFTGDLEKEAADAMIRTQKMPDRIDVLKLAHHGAKNGGTHILEKYKPTIGLASMGKNNRYRHPHSDIVSALERQGTLLGRTDIHGTVFVGFAPSGIRLYKNRS